MLLFPNALSCSLYERNCVCAVTKTFPKFLPANNFCQLLRVTRKRSCTSVGNAQAQLHFRDNQQRAFGVSNITDYNLYDFKLAVTSMPSLLDTLIKMLVNLIKQSIYATKMRFSMVKISWNALKFPERMCFPILLCAEEFPNISWNQEISWNITSLTHTNKTDLPAHTHTDMISQWHHC